MPAVWASVGLVVPSDLHPEGFVMPDPREYMGGKWEERNWRNVPGPFYGALTDNCWSGRAVAPNHILYDDAEHSSEFVFRQPRNDAEAFEVLFAAVDDPYAGYAFDGDDHWTLGSVRDWWADRGRLREWIEQAATRWAVSSREDEREIVHGLRAYAEYIDGELEAHLRGYLFWLDQARVPEEDEALPAL